MLKLYLLLSISLLCSCVATQQIEPEKFTIQLARHASHVVDECVFTFGLLPIVELDTITLSQDGAYLKLLIRVDECKMDGLRLSFDEPTMFDFYFNGDCINNTSLRQLFDDFKNEFSGYQDLVNDLNLKSVTQMFFEFEVLRCVNTKIYPVRGGYYRCIVNNGYISETQRFYLVSED